jgi:hypothetical protein
VALSRRHAVAASQQPSTLSARNYNSQPVDAGAWDHQRASGVWFSTWRAIASSGSRLCGTRSRQRARFAVMRSRISEGDARSRVASEKTAALFTHPESTPNPSAARAALTATSESRASPGDQADPLIPPIRLLGNVDDDNVPGMCEAIHYRSADAMSTPGHDVRRRIRHLYPSTVESDDANLRTGQRSRMRRCGLSRRSRADRSSDTLLKCVIPPHMTRAGSAVRIATRCGTGRPIMPLREHPVAPPSAGRVSPTVKDQPIASATRRPGPARREPSSSARRRQFD